MTLQFEEPLEDFMAILTAPQCKHCGSFDLYKDGIRKSRSMNPYSLKTPLISQMYHCKQCDRTSSYALDLKEHLRQLISAMRKYGLKVRQINDTEILVSLTGTVM